MSTSPPPPPPPTYPASAVLASRPHDAVDLEAQLPDAGPPPYKRTETSPPDVGVPPPPTYREVPLGPVVRMNDAQNAELLESADAVRQMKKRFLKFGVLLFVVLAVVAAVCITGAKYGSGNQKGSWKEDER